MCGIAGIIEADHPVREEELRPLLDAQKHRGPDAWGVWSDGLCALGHRRLSIIDLSDSGRQPLANEDGVVWITFNGEIYNFQALREELVGLGHRFRTRTDTEVIIHAYEQWDTDCVRRLRGMFAFAIWDGHRRRLFAARDRVGKKPLFYYQLPERFIFTSELQGLLADPRVPRDPDLQGIDAYLTWGYVPAPRTGFQGVSKLPPAHWMTVDVTVDGLAVEVEKYWSLEYGPKLQLSPAEAGEALREKLTEAVRLRMISDVPLGAFLSGGIDSSIIVGLMAGVSQRPVKTFSVGFTDASYNELDHARRIAEKWSTEHHELMVEPDTLTILPRLVRHYGEPHADSSSIPSFCISELTRRSVTVALNGDGGDENFAGYERYLGNRVAEQFSRVPGSRYAAELLSRVLPSSINPQSRLHKVHRFLEVAHRERAERFGQWHSYFSSQDKDRLYTPGFREQASADRTGQWMRKLFAAAPKDPVDAAMAVDIISYLPYDLLVKMDIASMASSLEARSPFLDHEVMEFAARLPVDLKLKRSQSKYLLKQEFRDLLPPENVYRQKMGFSVPVGRWLRGPLKELLCDTLLSYRCLSRGYFERGEVQRLVNEHTSSRTDHSTQLWNLLMLELWHQEMVEPTRARVETASA